MPLNSARIPTASYPTSNANSRYQLGTSTKLELAILVQIGDASVVVVLLDPLRDVAQFRSIWSNVKRFCLWYCSFEPSASFSWIRYVMNPGLFTSLVARHSNCVKD